MKKKDFTPKYAIETCQLMSMYRVSTLEVYGVNVYVPKTYLDKFLNFERSLIKHEISPSLYTTTILVLLRGWCKQKRLTYVPMNTFLGKWAMERYLKVAHSKSVEILGIDAEVHAELLHSELLVARAHMRKTVEAGRAVPMENTVEELVPMLSQEWLNMWNDKVDRPVTIEALDIIAYEYRLRKQYKTYRAVAKALLNGQ